MENPFLKVLFLIGIVVVNQEKVNQENSKKSVKSDHFGIKPVLFRFGEEDSKKSGYFASFTDNLTKQALLAQPLPKNLEILQVLQVVHSKSNTLTMTYPKNCD